MTRSQQGTEMIRTRHCARTEEDTLLSKMFQDFAFVKSEIPPACLELRRYSNIVEWSVEGLGLKSLYDYSRQYQTVRDFYELLCPVCAEDSDYDCWNKSPEELSNQILLRLDWEAEVFRCPVCDYVKERLGYENLVACIGMRAGKTVLGAIVSSYTLMMWFALGGRLESRFNLIPGQRLRMSMVSTASSQTEKTVWAAFTALLENAKNEGMKELLQKGFPQNNGTSRKSMQNMKEWRYGNLEVLCLHSNSSSLAGGTGILSILEEFSRFDIGESKRSAGEVHAVLDRSLKTVRNLKKTAIDDLFGRKVIISSPYYIGDLDPTLTEVRNAGSDTLAIHLPTWEFNPLMPRSCFDLEYKRDYWKAERDYGANPRGGSELFFEDEDAVLSCIQPGRGMRFFQTVEYKGSLKFITCKFDPFVDLNAEYAVHVDLSEKRDLMSMAFARKEAEGFVTVSGLMVLTPFSGLSLWLDTPLDIISELSRTMNIRLVTYDNWQSVSAIQRLGAMGIPVQRRSIGEEELIEFKKLSYLSRVKVLETGSDATFKLREEVKTLRRMNGKLSHVDVLMSVAGATTAWTLGEVGKKESMKGLTKQYFPMSRARVFKSARW